MSKRHRVRYLNHFSLMNEPIDQYEALDICSLVSASGCITPDCNINTFTFTFTDHIISDHMSHARRIPKECHNYNSLTVLHLLLISHPSISSFNENTYQIYVLIYPPTVSATYYKER